MKYKLFKRMSGNKKNTEETIQNPERTAETESAESAFHEGLPQVPHDAVSELEDQLSIEKDKFLRLHAEFDNFRKRNIKERIELIKMANAELISSLLAVLDDFERALKSLENADASAKEGVALIYNKFKILLEQKGVTVMESTGTDFNSDLHDAITSIEVEDEKMKGKVIEDIEKGYYLYGNVIRHAKVVVGK